MADQSNILSRIPGRTTLVDGGASTSAPINGVMLNSPAAGANTWTSVETQDTCAIVGNVGITGPWASTEATDTCSMAGAPVITGVWTSTEATDVCAAFVFVPPQAVWTSTELPDRWNTGGHIKPLRILHAEQHATSFDYTTTERDLILVMVYTSGAAGSDNSPSFIDTITVTDHPEITFTPQDNLIVGPDNDGHWLAGQILWAYAPEPLDAKHITITTVPNFAGDVGSTTGNIAIFAVQGMQGSFGNPFTDPNILCRGTGISGLTGSSLQVGSFTPVVTGGYQGGSSLSSVTFAGGTLNHATLSNGNLSVNSDGTNNSNYAEPPVTASQEANIYFEVKFDQIFGTDYATGLMWQGIGVPASLLASGDGGIIIRGNGDIVTGGTVTGHVATPANGDVIGIAVNAKNHMIFAANLTQGEVIPGSFNYSGYGGRATPAFFIAGGLGSVSQTDSGVQRRGYSNSGSLIPIAFPGGTNINAKQTYNFGASAFVGTPPPGYGPWAKSVSVAPTRIHYPSVIVGFSATVNSTGQPIPDTPAGYTQIISANEGGSQVDVGLQVYASIRSQNVLESDNDFQINGSHPHWGMMFDTMVVGDPSPGDWESTEAADTCHLVGYPGAFGIVGNLASTEATDIFAANGFVASVGSFNVTETPDIFSMFIKIPVQGPWVSTEATDHFAATGLGRGEDGTWISTEAIDIFAASGTVPISGSFDTFEAPDRFLALGAGVTQVRRRRSFFVT